MSKSAFGGMVGGSNGSTIVELFCDGQGEPVYQVKTDSGPAFMYNLVIDPEELMQIFSLTSLPSHMEAHLETLSREEIRALAQDISGASTPAGLIRQVVEQEMKVMIVTDKMLSSRGALEVIFAGPSLRLRFLKSLLDGMGLAEARALLMEQVQRVYSNAEDSIIRPIFGGASDEDEDAAAEEEQFGGDYDVGESKDFLDLLFFNNNTPPCPQMLLNESSLLDDMETIQIADPLIATMVLKALGYLNVSNDFFLCCKPGELQKCLPKVREIAEPERVGAVIDMLVRSANAYGGNKYFHNVNRTLRADARVRWIEPKTPNPKELVNKPASVLQKIKQNLLPISASAAAHDFAALRQQPQMIRGLPIPVMTGGAPRFSSMSDVWEKLLLIRKQELSNENKRLSKNTWSQIIKVLHHYRELEDKLFSIEAALDQYRRTLDNSNPEEIEDMAVVQKLLEEYNDIDLKKKRNTVRINDIFSTLFDVIRSSPPVIPAA